MFLFAAVASAATLSVGPNQPYATIQSAIDAAAPGDIVAIDTGVYIEALTIDVELTLMGSGPGVTIAPSPGQTPQPTNVAVQVHAPTTFVGLTLDGRGENNLVLADAPTTFDSVVLMEFSAYAVHGGGAIDMANSYVAGQVLNHPAVSAGGYDPSAGVVRVRDTTFDDLFIAVRTDPGGIVRDSTFLGGDVGIQVGQVDNGRAPARIIANDFLGVYAGVAVEPIEARTQTSVVLTGNLFQDNSVGLHVSNVTDEAWYQAYLGQPIVSTPVGVRAFQNTFAGNTGDFSPDYAMRVIGESDMVLNSNAIVGFDVAIQLTETTYAPLDVVAEYNLTDGPTLFESDLGMAPAVSNTNLVGVDAMHTDYVDDGVFDDDFTPLPGSPLLDGGTPARLDPDGSVADIGHLPWR